jgi:hypothetical protein
MKLMHRGFKALAKAIRISPLAFRARGRILKFTSRLHTEASLQNFCAGYYAGAMWRQRMKFRAEASLS